MKKNLTMFYDGEVSPQKGGEITVVLFLVDTGIDILGNLRCRILVVVLGFEFALV